MQVEITKESVHDAGPRFRGKLLWPAVRVKVWEDGENVTVDIPHIQQVFTAEYKDSGGTPENQLVSWIIDIIKQVRQAKAEYNREQILMNHAKFTAAIQTLKTQLEI